MGILSLVLKNWQLVVICVLVALLSVLSLYIKSLKKDIEVTESEKNVLKVELQVSQASVKSLQVAMNEQNAAVEKFKADAELREKNNKIIIQRAKNEAERNAKRASDFMNRKPDPNQPICKSADDLINEAIRNAKTK